MVSALALGACETTTTSEERPKPSPEQTENRINSAIEKALQDAENRGNKQESLLLLEQIYKRNSADPVVAARFARALREDEQLNKARLVLKPHTTGKKAHPDTLTEMAMVHLGLGDYQSAEETARESIALNPDQGRAFLALGTALDAQNRHEQAEEAFRQGLSHWKGDPAPILNNLALNLASQGNLKESLNVLEKARSLSPRRMEIERNYRIISTLYETSSGQSRRSFAPPPPAPSHKPDAPESLKNKIVIPAPATEKVENAEVEKVEKETLEEIQNLEEPAAPAQTSPSPKNAVSTINRRRSLPPTR